MSANESATPLPVLVLQKKNSTYTINCPKGLWAVSGGDRTQVIREALHYFWQYADEYALTPPAAVK